MAPGMNQLKMIYLGLHNNNSWIQFRTIFSKNDSRPQHVNLGNLDLGLDHQVLIENYQSVDLIIAQPDFKIALIRVS